MSDSPILQLLLWFGVSGTLYAYLGFPALIAALAAMKKRVGGSSAGLSDAARMVTVIVPAFNEEGVLGEKIRNVLASKYPRRLLEVIVVSDASTDRTDEIARGFAKDGVYLIVQQTRCGKTAGLNRALEKARGEVIVFTDANAMYPADTIFTLSRSFDDPRVGLVTGSTRYLLSEDGAVTESTNAYTRLERVVKRAESAWGCCVGADGAIFAMRKTLYRPLREDDINDFVIPLGVIEQGYRCVFSEEAHCLEHSGTNLESEFRRQSRITNRTLGALWRNRRLLNPLRFPLFSSFLFSHKVARFLVPFFLVLSGVSLALLAPTGGVYLWAAAICCLALVLAALAKLSSSGGFQRLPLGRPIAFLSIFLTINVAVLSGWWKFLSGRSDVTWQHDRSRR